jgi:hypothetical protein
VVVQYINEVRGVCRVIRHLLQDGGRLHGLILLFTYLSNSENNSSHDLIQNRNFIKFIILVLFCLYVISTGTEDRPVAGSER